MSARIRELQTDLKTLGFDPGKIDGIWGKRTAAAIEAYCAKAKRLPTDADLAERIAEEADARSAITTNLVIKIDGDKDDIKPKVRDFTKPLYLQVHQTDYWPGERCASMLTNLYVSTKAVYEVHTPDEIVEHNYSDFYHLEVAWVSESRKSVPWKGKIHHREAGVWTPEREALLEVALVYGVTALRSKGQDPLIITHNQTYTRSIDPDIEIAQAAYRIAKKHVFRLDFGWSRGSGKSAALWYPAGCGKLP
jgi:hypothetical protein